MFHLKVCKKFSWIVKTLNPGKSLVDRGWFQRGLPRSNDLDTLAGALRQDGYHSVGNPEDYHDQVNDRDEEDDSEDEGDEFHDGGSFLEVVLT